MATKTDAISVVTSYFEAIARRDLDGLASHWADDGEEIIAGQFHGTGPREVRAYFAGLFAAVPDLLLEPTQIVLGDEGRVTVHWRARGTFTGQPYQGIAPTGRALDLDGLDLLRVADGKIVRNDAYIDGMTFARQIGMMPSKDSPAERRMVSAFNAKTKASRRALTSDLERVADGVWLLRGGVPRKTMNVYFIEEPDGSGVVLFDAGIKAMASAVRTAGAQLGGITRVVLGHAHPDHRGVAAALGAPVHCHADERADAEGDGGDHYLHPERLRLPARYLLPAFFPWWDGGPVEVAGTLAEGDEVAGFEVVHVPGHAPGQIALHRASDRLALTTDTFYTINVETLLNSAPRIPHPAFNHDTEQARASIRKLAALEPAAAWPGHANPVLGNVREQLERAADG